MGEVSSLEEGTRVASELWRMLRNEPLRSEAWNFDGGGKMV